jgi:hypothetical protein
MAALNALTKVKALLDELKQDDYVKFRYGKAIENALKVLESHTALDPAEIELGLTDLLELVRGKKGGTPAGAGPKRRSSSKTEKEPVRGPA